jgi:hypothetical protein
MKEVKYKCLCEHNEDEHNFDPDSVMFGCLHTMITWSRMPDGSPTEPEETYCSCREFRPDTLRYVEDLYVNTHCKSK